jgi:hypothetical protein
MTDKPIQRVEVQPDHVGKLLSVITDAINSVQGGLDDASHFVCTVIAIEIARRKAVAAIEAGGDEYSRYALIADQMMKADA